MHRLHRDSLPVPECLSEPGHHYRDLCGAEKAQIRAVLLSMQGDRCAYCERRTGVDADDGHIEHFRDQANHETLECEWTNLFWSCNDPKTCGRHKDTCRKAAGPLKCFNNDDIIDPAREDPEAFLLFVSDGTVRPRDGLSDADRHRAEETLRVFQLDNSPYLRKLRKDAVKPHIDFVELLASREPSLVRHYVQKTIEELATMPFATAIKGFLRSVVDE